MTTERLYHMIAINPTTKQATRLTRTPATHKECMIMKSKYSPSSQSRITVEDYDQGKTISK